MNAPQRVICAIACAVLSACSGTGPVLDRLSDVPFSNPEIDPVEAAVALAAAPAEQADAPSGFFGMFGGRSAAEPTPAAVRTGPDARLIAFGESIDYGEIATVCGVSASSLGSKIADISGFEIYDSIPNSTAQRPHYIMGFDDGCARQFTAALTLPGDVGTHEVVRYLPSNRIPYSTTDNAYEAIKAGFCRVSHGQPCGRQLDNLARNTTFLTVYEKFGAGKRWVEILLHDGAVKAIDFKEP